MPVEMVTRRIKEDGDERGMLIYGRLKIPSRNIMYLSVVKRQFRILIISLVYSLVVIKTIRRSFL